MVSCEIFCALSFTYYAQSWKWECNDFDVDVDLILMSEVYIRNAIFL